MSQRWLLSALVQSRAPFPVPTKDQCGCTKMEAEKNEKRCQSFYRRLVVSSAPYLLKNPIKAIAET